MTRSHPLARWIVLLAALLALEDLSGPALAAEASAAVSEPTTEAKSSLKVVEIPVEGMACISCAASVKGAVKALSGIVAVEVSLEKRNARVTYRPNLLTPIGSSPRLTSSATRPESRRTHRDARAVFTTAERRPRS